MQTHLDQAGVDERRWWLKQMRAEFGQEGVERIMGSDTVRSLVNAMAQSIADRRKKETE